MRAGKGFSYRGVDGSTVTDPETRERIEQLAIPPAWTDVWISPYGNGHIQATGTDAAGRTQYIYHPAWRLQKDRLKFDRALELAASLPAARRAVTIDLRAAEPTSSRALAAAFRMLDTGLLRVGSERYADEHGSRGLSTLLCAHAGVSGDVVELGFPGKSGQEWRLELADPDLVAFVRVMKRRGSHARLLAWKDGRAWHPLNPADINGYVRERTGGDFTSKDFRTLHGTVAAAVSLASAGPRKSPAARKRVVAQAAREVAEALGNTPAIARGSYIDPRVIDRYERGGMLDPKATTSAESRLLDLLLE